jgi:hypothetical protein
MKKLLLRLVPAALCLLPFTAGNAWAESTPSALTCADFRPTQAALERFPDLVGACQEVVERDGELYGKFPATVRRASYNSVTLYLPVADHTFTIKPQSDARVLIGGRKYRPRDLERGQEVNIYLLASAFATPNVEEVALVTEADVMITHEVAPAAALPTTASPWPTVGAGSVLLLTMGWVIRRRRLSA